MNALLAAYASQTQNVSQQPPVSSQPTPSDDIQDSVEIEACFRRLQLNEHSIKQEDYYSHQELTDPLGQIRVLLLAPSTNTNDPIHCTLQVITLEETKSVNFKALSYACGDQNSRRDIFINGRKLSVTFNLEEALKALRDATRFQRFWADAICIHQTNLVEKSKQILLMQDIYARATQVVIWLGQSDDELDVVFRQLAGISSDNKQKQTAFFYQLFQFATESNEVLRGYIKLWQKAWFSRVWCTQEYLVASRTPIVVCGSYRIPWNVISLSVMAIDMIWPSKKSAIQKRLQEASTHSMSGALDVNYQVQKRLTLGMALQSTASKNATDPRDKIYAVLGLVSPDVRAALAPDYTKPLGQVYQDAMMAMINEHKTLNPLWAAAGSSRNHDLKLPSWCLDFSNTQWQRTLTALHVFPLMHGPALITTGRKLGQIEKAYFAYDAQTSSLSIDCAVVDALLESTPMTFAPFLHEYNQLEKLMAEDPAAAETEALAELATQVVFHLTQSVKNATESFHTWGLSHGKADATTTRIQAGEVWQTMLRGHDMKNLLGPIWTKAGLPVPKNFDLFESYLRDSRDTRPAPSTWDVDIPPGTKSRISHSKLVEDCIIKSCFALAQASPNRAFIMTNTGWLGNATVDVKVGDLLCVAPTCLQPLVLRTQGTDQHGRPMYNLVGSARVSKLMQDERFRPGNTSTTIFQRVTLF